jgi:transposase
MGLSRRTYTKEFKLAAVQRMEQGVSIGEVARALEVNPNVLHRWRREFRHGPGNAFPGNGKPRWSEGRIAELERKIGQQALEIDFLKGCLQRRPRAKDDGRPYRLTRTPVRLRFWSEEQRMLQALTGNPRSTGRLKKK